MSSCNGCRVLRKGCSDDCILRQSLTCINSPKSQCHATLFVSKFVGRAPLLSFLASVPVPLRPVVFQSLLYEACGRTINPVTGVIGLLHTGNWNLCMAAVETVLQGGILTPLKGVYDGGSLATTPCSTEVSEVEVDVSRKKRRRSCDNDMEGSMPIDLELRLMSGVTNSGKDQRKKRVRASSLGSEESGTTWFGSGSSGDGQDEVEGSKELRLFF